MLVIVNSLCDYTFLDRSDYCFISFLLPQYHSAFIEIYTHAYIFQIQCNKARIGRTNRRQNLGSQTTAQRLSHTPLSVDQPSLIFGLRLSLYQCSMRVNTLGNHIYFFMHPPYPGIENLRVRLCDGYP